MIVRVLMQTIVLALGQLWANKVRALLTTLGIVIGVAAVIIIVASTNGLRQFVLNEFETFGAKKVFIDGRVPRSDRGTMSWRSVQLSLDEIRAIQDRAESIDQITPMMMGGYEVRSGEVKEVSLPVTGIWPSWHEIEARSVTQGRPFNSVDEEQALAVCLINDKAIEELQLDRDPIGDSIFIKGRRFVIVGIVETKDLSGLFGGGETQTEIFIPFQTAQNMNPDQHISFAVAQLRSPTEADNAKAEVGFILRRMRGLKPEQQDTYVVEVLQQFIDQFNNVARVIGLGATVIVGISLLVGGIGIMNIMLVSVSERTREIGLRKAVGARPEVILMQFLVEAVTLCVAGGALGLLIGQLAVLGIRMAPAMKYASIPLWAVGLAVGFSAATGLFFGMFPAIKAARLDPIVALRHE